MLFVISAIHVVVCLFLILVVLLQQGKGADLSVFGGGGTQAAFGARGATTLLHKLTVGAFVGFILTTMAIGLLKNTAGDSSVITDMPAAAPVEEQQAGEQMPAVLEDLAPAGEEMSAPAEAPADAEAATPADDGGQ